MTAIAAAAASGLTLSNVMTFLASKTVTLFVFSWSRASSTHRHRRQVPRHRESAKLLKTSSFSAFRTGRGNRRFPNHAWDESGPRNISTTTIQTFPVFFLGGGWTLGTAGITKYAWEDEQWTVPLNLGVSRTMRLGGTPWKFGLEANYYIERSDRLGPEWMIGLNVSPVVPNMGKTRKTLSVAGTPRVLELPEISMRHGASLHAGIAPPDTCLL